MVTKGFLSSSVRRLLKTFHLYLYSYIFSSSSSSMPPSRPPFFFLPHISFPSFVQYHQHLSSTRPPSTVHLFFLRSIFCITNHLSFHIVQHLLGEFLDVLPRPTFNCLLVVPKTGQLTTDHLLPHCTTSSTGEFLDFLTSARAKKTGQLTTDHLITPLSSIRPPITYAS